MFPNVPSAFPQVPGQATEIASLLQDISEAPFRTRTGDPLLTMELHRQPVATGCNGFGLFSPLPPSVDLPLVATGCNHGAP